METPARLIVDLGRLDDGRTEHLVGMLDQAVLELDDLEQIHPAGPLNYDLRCELLGEEFLVRGGLALDCACVCSRCGGDFTAQFEEPDYCETFDVSGLETLDLTESVREGIILALPSYPICKEECKGVCLHCGKNLNAGLCDCPSNTGASPWEALAGLTPEA